MNSLQFSLPNPSLESPPVFDVSPHSLEPNDDFETRIEDALLDSFQFPSLLVTTAS